MNIANEITKIRSYLIDKYSIKEIKKKDWMDERYLLFKIKNDTKLFKLHLNYPTKDSFAPNDYLLHFGYEDKTSGGSYAEPYKKDFDIIDKFINENIDNLMLIKPDNQVTIFELIGE